LWLSAWRIEALGERIDGGACWITGVDAALRIEIVRLPGPLDPVDDRQQQELLASLKQRRGDGWTYAKSASVAPGLLQSWGRRWRQVSPDLASLLRTLATALAGGAEALETDAGAYRAEPRVAGAANGRWRSTAPARDRPAAITQLSVEFWLRDPDDAAAARSVDRAERLWRRDLVARGRGRGGLIETVTLAWQSGGKDDARSELVVRSRRRAGALYLWPLSATEVRYPPDETFLPLWPLEQILTP
jgi:hypothetical protein